MKRMIGPDEAIRSVLDIACPMAPTKVGVTDALGLTLAEDVVADRGYPPFPRAMMDGYAVRLADAGSTVPVVGEVAAGQSRDEPLRDGTAVSIMTGAPCPPGTEAVVPHEETTIGDEDVALPADLTPGRHIAPTGCECAAGVVVAVQGEEVTPLVIANLATFGYTEVSVVPPPRCAVVTTGSELVAPASEPGIAQIRDSNGPMMAAMTRLIGVSDVRQLHAGDTEQALDSKLADTEESDVVILTGGVSAGKYDLVPGTLEAHGVEIVFHKVMQKPGKPLLFGHIGSRLFFGLPGNPLACHMGFNRYIAPAIRKMMGKDPSPRVGEGRLATSVEPRGSRTRFMPCRTVPVDDGWKINVLNGKGSADIFASCPANSYIRVEPGTETLQEGTLVPFEWNWNSP